MTVSYALPYSSYMDGSLGKYIMHKSAKLPERIDTIDVTILSRTETGILTIIYLLGGKHFRFHQYRF